MGHTSPPRPHPQVEVTCDQGTVTTQAKKQCKTHKDDYTQTKRQTQSPKTGNKNFESNHHNTVDKAMDVLAAEDSNEENGKEANTSATNNDRSIVKMTEESVRRWKFVHSSVDNMKQHINSVLKQRSDSLYECQQRFTEVLAQLALLKDNEEELMKEYGKIYQWVWEYRKEMKTDVDACVAATYAKEVLIKGVEEQKSSSLPDGWRLMLQLYTKGRWWDWIYLQKSNQVVVDVGVFAARDFPKGSIIGYLCGPTIWTSDAAGGPKPSEQDLARQGVKRSKGAVSFRNGMACWQYIQPCHMTEKPGPSLYVGMHYVNSACWIYKVGSKQYKGAKKHQNCSMLEDGSICALKKIQPNVELFSNDGFNMNHCESVFQSEMYDNNIMEQMPNGSKKGTRKRRACEEEF
jgi:hypothetical protein